MGFELTQNGVQPSLEKLDSLVGIELDKTDFLFIGFERQPTTLMLPDFEIGLITQVVRLTIRKGVIKKAEDAHEELQSTKKVEIDGKNQWVYYKKFS